MSIEDDNKAALIPSQPSALSRTGASSLITRGLDDLLHAESADVCCKRGDESRGQHNYVEAMHWWRMAAGKGDVHAMAHLGNVYREGRYVELDESESMRWYRMAADKGEAWAAVIVGECYRDGIGAPLDSVKAMRWYRRAVDSAGHTAAMYSIGQLFENGLGVQQDYAEAMRWYRLVADADWNCNSGNALFSIGRLYHFGRGVTKDVSVAAYWYDKAMMLGNMGETEAEEALAKLVETGVKPHAPEAEYQ